MKQKTSFALSDEARRLLDFARRKTPEKKFTDLNALIRDVVRFIDRAAHLQDTAIEMDLDPDLPRLWVDEDQVKQVFMNMLVNAEQATAPGGSTPASAESACTSAARRASTRR